MKKVFLDDLPRKGKLIDWKNSIGYEVKFIYDDIDGYINIEKYYMLDKRPYIDIKYNNSYYSMLTTQLSQCAFNFILNKKTKKFKHDISKVIKNERGGKIEILEQVKMPNGKYTQKGYKYKCLICGNIGKITERELTNHHGCNVCSNQKVLIGYNDLWTTHPEVAKLLLDVQAGYTISFGSAKQEKFKCQDCGYERKIKINKVVRYGVMCPKCGDGISYPEKFMFNLLEQLNIDFIPQLNKSIFDWCDNFRYDFYIPSLNCIIETHGLQHYEKSKGNWHSLSEIQENDNCKKQLAKNNHINNYIVVDCKISDYGYIKNNILSSELSKIFDLSNIDWNKCEKYALGSLVKTICNLWENIKDVYKISKLTNMSYATTQRYLKKGGKIGLCNYNPENNHLKTLSDNSKKLSKKIICITTLEIFHTITEAFNKYNLKSNGSITKCCKNDKNYSYSGKHPITGEKLKWMYYEDYLKQVS